MTLSRELIRPPYGPPLVRGDVHFRSPGCRFFRDGSAEREMKNRKQKTGQFGRFYISGFRFPVFHSLPCWDEASGPPSLPRRGLGGGLLRGAHPIPSTAMPET